MRRERCFLKSNSAEMKAVLADRFESQQARVTVEDPGMVRMRIAPVVLALEGLAKRVVFDSLDKDNAGQTAPLMLRYAKGETPLDAGRSSWESRPCHTNMYSSRFWRNLGGKTRSCS